MDHKNREDDEIARAWIDYNRPEKSSGRDELFWSFDTLYELVRKEPEEAWTIIEMIRCLDGSDHILANLAAGPVEDLLAKHGEKFVDRVEVLARTDAQFRKMLGAVWQNSISDAIWSRIKSVVGPSW